MRASFFLLGAIVCLLAVPLFVRCGPMSSFTQLQDHFDPENFHTWEQRYEVEANGWKDGDPIFLFLGGEAPLPVFDFQTVLPKTFAREQGFKYIGIEHRYYGESSPVHDFSTDNMRFLSSRQALADAAAFIVSQNENMSKPSPWVVWGCSYSGALSAWFRAKYPNLVVASIAPSGPVQAQANYTGYFDLFPSVAPAECVSAIKQAVTKIYGLLTTKDGVSKLESTFNTCKHLDAEEDVLFFLDSLTTVVGSSDQFQNPDAHWPLNETCDKLTKGGSDYVTNWASIMKAQYPNDTCVPIASYHDFIKTFQMHNVQENIGGGRSWEWQKCTEFGYFKPSLPPTSPFFTVQLEYYLQTCPDIFKIDGMKPDIEGTNSYYGAKDLVGSSILFTNGLKDPWHLLSITKDKPGIKAITYEAGHCAPMTAPSQDDPPSLVQARKEVKSFVLQALKQTKSAMNVY